MEESHFLTMMRMVQPHVSGRPKRSVELMLQSAELLHSVQQYREPELSACDTGQDFVDFEAMLTDLQTVCNPAESEFINLILNFFRSRKIYSAYRTAASQQNFQQSQTAQEIKDSVSMETSHLSETGNLSQESSDTSTILSAAEKAEAVSMEKTNPSSVSADNNKMQGTYSENQTVNPNRFVSDTSNPNPDRKTNLRNRQGPANTFRNLIGNQAIQSLLSPSQKENLNQIESIMQVLS